MTWAGFVWKNLQHRRARTLLTAAGVAIGVALIVALLSIAAGVRNTAKDLIHIGRADFGVFQEGASDLTRSLLPQSLEGRIRATQGVEDVAGVFLRVSKVDTADSFLVFGYNPHEFAYRRLVIVRGHRPAGGRQALLGDLGAKTLHVAPGDTITVEKRRFRVADRKSVV